MILTNEEEEAGSDEEQEQIREKTVRQGILGGCHDGYISLCTNRVSPIDKMYENIIIHQALIKHQ